MGDSRGRYSVLPFDNQVKKKKRTPFPGMRSAPVAVVAKWALVGQSTWHKHFDMELAALVAVTLLLGALVILVAIAVGKRNEEIREEAEQAAESAGKSHIS